MLTEKEKLQYSRHILLDEIGLSGQEKLKKSKVLVVGAGGLGCPVLQYLASAGVGTIGIVDSDVVEVSNLQRQILFTNEDVGKPKVEVAKISLQKMNKFIKILTFNEALSSQNAISVFQQFDVIIEGTDSFVCKYLTNDAAVLTQKPFILGSIFKFEGQISVYNYKGGPTYRCLFPEVISPDKMPTCSEIGVLSALPGLIGSFMAIEAIKLLTGVGDLLVGKLLKIDLLTLNLSIFSFEKDNSIQIKELKEIAFHCSSKEVREIEYNEYLKHSDDFNLLDVRTVKERQKFHIGGLHIPLNQLTENLNKIPTDKPIVVYCASGKRSAQAITILSEMIGNVSFFSLKGGIMKI